MIIFSVLRLARLRLYSAQRLQPWVGVISFHYILLLPNKVIGENIHLKFHFYVDDIQLYIHPTHKKGLSSTQPYNKVKTHTDMTQNTENFSLVLLRKILGIFEISYIKILSNKTLTNKNSSLQSRIK